MDNVELKLGGFNLRTAHLLVVLPVLSAVAGGAYWGYDVLNRFLDVESGFEEVINSTSRIQALEEKENAFMIAFTNSNSSLNFFLFIIL